MSETLSWGARDANVHLHSYTNPAAHETRGADVMVRGQGCWLYDSDGKEYLDGIAGLWCVTLGYSEPRLVDAAHKQLQTLPYYHTFKHQAHDKVVELSEALLGLAPDNMARVTFQSSGSEANETAIKLIRLYQNARGLTSKKRLLARNRGYHGSSIAAASLTGTPGMHAYYDLPIPEVLFTEAPDYFNEKRDGESVEAFHDRKLDQLEVTIAEVGGENIAAMFLDPLMSAGGIMLPTRAYYSRLQSILRKHDILIVADEVICGFGRTGSWWGHQTFGFEPDIITCAKGLTSGYIPLSATIISEQIYTTISRFLGEKSSAMSHGFTYGGHPVGCAVAIEAINIYKERDIPAVVAKAGATLKTRLESTLTDPLVGEIRQVGLFAGVQLTAANLPAHLKDQLPKIAEQVTQHAQRGGLMTRSLMNVLAFAPPFVITDSEIDQLTERLTLALQQTRAEFGIGD